MLGTTERGVHAIRAGTGSFTRPLLPLMAVGLALGLWELVTRTNIVAATQVPPMSVTTGELWSLLQTGSFWSAVAGTLRGWAIGLGIAAGLAVPIGIALGSSEFAAAAFRVPIEFLRPIPSVALIPLLLLAVGPNLKSEIFLASFAAFWPLLIQTMYGVRDVDPLTLDTGRSFGLGPLERLYRITLPSAVPYIGTGLRISSSVSLILAFTAELFMGTPGLGRAINLAQNAGQDTQVYALALATGFLGLTLSLVFTRIERYALRWHPSQRSAVL